MNSTKSLIRATRHQREMASTVDKAEAWDGAQASFERGRRAGLKEALKIAQEQARMWADEASKAATRRADVRLASGAAGCIAGIIRARLEQP